jgi:hypothetical protein
MNTEQVDQRRRSDALDFYHANAPELPYQKISESKTTDTLTSANPTSESSGGGCCSCIISVVTTVVSWIACPFMALANCIVRLFVGENKIQRAIRTQEAVLPTFEECVTSDGKPGRLIFELIKQFLADPKGCKALFGQLENDLRNNQQKYPNLHASILGVLTAFGKMDVSSADEEDVKYQIRTHLGPVLQKYYNKSGPDSIRLMFFDDPTFTRPYRVFENDPYGKRSYNEDRFGKRQDAIDTKTTNINPSKQNTMARMLTDHVAVLKELAEDRDAFLIKLIREVFADRAGFTESLLAFNTDYLSNMKKYINKDHQKYLLQFIALEMALKTLLCSKSKYIEKMGAGDFQQTVTNALYPILEKNFKMTGIEINALFFKAKEASTTQI